MAHYQTEGDGWFSCEFELPLPIPTTPAAVFAPDLTFSAALPAVDLTFPAALPTTDFNPA